MTIKEFKEKIVYLNNKKKLSELSSDIKLTENEEIELIKLKSKINEIKNDTHKMILKSLYLCGMRITEVASFCGYTKRTVYRYYELALEELKIIIFEEEDLLKKNKGKPPLHTHKK